MGSTKERDKDQAWCDAVHYVNTEITLKLVHKGLLVGPFGNLLEFGFKVQWWLAELM